MSRMQTAYIGKANSDERSDMTKLVDIMPTEEHGTIDMVDLINFHESLSRCSEDTNLMIDDNDEFEQEYFEELINVQ